MTRNRSAGLSKAGTVAYGGLLLAMGILLPQVFHLFGGKAAGGMLLPMHIPVLLSGYLLGPWWGLAIGAATPAVSALTGMPPLFRLPFMMLELAAYGLCAGLLGKKLCLPMWLGLPATQAAGRLVYLLSLLVAGNLFHMQKAGAIMAWTATVEGLPGIILQWFFVPLLVWLAKKRGVTNGN